MRYLKSLQKLYTQKELNYSAIPKKLIQKLEDENLIDIKRVTAKGKKVIAKEEFFNVYSNLKDIETATTRAELTLAKSDSKQKHISPQDGLFISGNAMIGTKKD